MAARRIIPDPKVMMGKPVIAGTRITVELILTRLAEGRSVADILEEYPHPTEAQVTTAVNCPGDLVERPVGAE